MLFFTFVFSLLIFPTFCDVLCYDCSSAPDRYDYIITSDKIPPELQNCQNKTSQSLCTINISWQLTTNITEIYFGPDDNTPSSSKDILTVTTFLSGIQAIQQKENSFTYRCSSDRCNDASTFKRIFDSLSIHNSLNELESLLKPDEPFDGRTCLLYSNQTDDECTPSSSIDPTICTQCSTEFISKTKDDIICATCSKDIASENELFQSMFFNMTDRTIVSAWVIRCQSKDCNGVSTGSKIRDKGKIGFDFNKFLGNNSSRQQLTSFLITFAMIMITFIINISYCN